MFHLLSWYSLGYAVVRWNNFFYNKFYLRCGVRQGGVLSSVLFAVYVNTIIEELSKSGHGCHMRDVFIGCVMYADDLLLISAFLYDLQRMTSLCAIGAGKLDMKFNANKSQIIRIGQMRRIYACYISIGGFSIQCVHVYFVSNTFQDQYTSNECLIFSVL